MSLNESQQQELAKILASDLFQNAKDLVLSLSSGSVDGLPLDQAAIKMSNERGVRNAFRLLEKICRPDFQHNDPLKRQSLIHTPRKDQ